MAEQDGNIHGPAVTGEGKRPADMTEDEKHERGAELEERRLREEEPDPNQHGPAVAGRSDAEEALEAWQEEYAMSPSEYLARYGEDASGSSLALAAQHAEED